MKISMSKIDCIVLGGGHLITGKRQRSPILKGSEEINKKELGSYILDTLSKFRDQIDNIVYLGDNLTHTTNQSVHYTFPSNSKGCIPTIQLGNDVLKTIAKTQNDIVLVICGDIPLVGEKEIDFLLQHRPLGRNYLTLFGVNNTSLQSQYTDFNKEKRFLELQEQEFIFGNAFLIRKEALDCGLEYLKSLDENGIKATNVFKLLLSLSGKNLLIALKLLIFGNIKFFDRKIPKILKKIPKPTSQDMVTLIEGFIGKKGVHLVHDSPNELVIDFDRSTQLPFFTKHLS